MYLKLTDMPYEVERPAPVRTRTRLASTRWTTRWEIATAVSALSSCGEIFGSNMTSIWRGRPGGVMVKVRENARRRVKLQACWLGPSSWRVWVLAVLFVDQLRDERP